MLFRSKKKRLLKRLQSLEEFLGVLYDEDDDYPSHSARNWGRSADFDELREGLRAERDAKEEALKDAARKKIKEGA